MRRPAVCAALAAVALLLAGCGPTGTDEEPASGNPPRSSGSPPGEIAGTSSQTIPATISGTVTVLAAASLNAAFTELGQRFEAAHPGVTVTFGFGPSSGLATQILQGAPADVFASASPGNMAQVVAAGEAVSPADFARNTMQIAVPVDNPAGIGALADLARPGVTVALCQPAVPCGATAATVFSNARLTVTPVTQEVDVKAVLTKVALGEVDAGLVYVTDVRAAGDKVKGIAIPAEANASTTYPIATLAKAPNSVGARAFADYVLSVEAASVLRAAGFAGP